MLHKNSDEKARQVLKIFLPAIYEKKRHLEDYVFVFEVSSENKTDITSKQTEVD